MCMILVLILIQAFFSFENLCIHLFSYHIVYIWWKKSWYFVEPPMLLYTKLTVKFTTIMLLLGIRICIYILFKFYNCRYTDVLHSCQCFIFLLSVIHVYSREWLWFLFIHGILYYEKQKYCSDIKSKSSIFSVRSADMFD